MPTVKQMRAAIENQLGIERVHNDAQTAKLALDKILTELSELRDKKRNLENLIADLEVNIIQDVWVNNPELAQTRLDKLVKNSLIMSPPMRELRDQLGKVLSEIDGLECDMRIAETTVKISCARMNELSGYLIFLASIMPKE